MAEHSLVVDRFAAALALAGTREDGPALAGEVARTVRERVPARCAARLAPLFGDRTGVVRIERVRLSLALGRADLGAEALADRIAAALAQSIAAGLGRASAAPGVAIWPDHAAFAASYVAHRLRLVAGPGWAFADFAALDLLAGDEAALELIAARPAVLAALARLLARDGAAARFATALPEATAAALVARLLEAAPAPDPDARGSALKALVEDGRRAGDDPARQARTMIALAAGRLARALDDTSAEVVVAILAEARLAVALVRVAAAIAERDGRALRASDLAPGGLRDLPPRLRALAETALAPFGVRPEQRAALAALVGAAPRSDPRPRSRDDVASPEPEEVPERRIASRFAGLGLLVPSMLEHGLPDVLAPGALHRVFVAALAEEDRPAARLDPLLAALAPVDPREPPPAFPPVPDRLREALPDGARAALADVEGAPGWAACLTRAFAGRLAGFEDSSIPYLRRQFLARPGTLVVAPGRLTLTLDPVPLAVILRFSGMIGWSGRLAHAGDALMRIAIRET